MEVSAICETFSSLSQETRLEVFKLLIGYGSDGVAPGKISGELGIPANTLSFHLSHMSRAGLVTSEKRGRSITYFANVGLIEELIGFLKTNCCARQRKSARQSCKEGKC